MLRKTANAFAPAKINLTLHVTGQRPDGYHLLDSLVVFADVGDDIQVTQADTLTLHLDGPYAATVPAGADNLVLRAAALLHAPLGADITLHKNLPTAAGIGGGSSDAAATMRALCDLWGVQAPPNTASLGADVAVCRAPNAQRMRGIGDALQGLPTLPTLHAVLVNPNVPVATPDVFAVLQNKTNPPMPAALPHWPNAAALITWLADQRNDLQTPAVKIAPVISDVLAALHSSETCELSRMSGSGATCFGLYPSADTAQAAAVRLSAQHPDWWVAATVLR